MKRHPRLDDDPAAVPAWFRLVRIAVFAGMAAAGFYLLRHL